MFSRISCTPSSIRKLCWPGFDCRIGEVVTQAINLKEEFPQLFTGLGKLKTEYQIKLNPEVELVSVHTPRRIPHPLLPKVKNEIDSMLKQGVISPVIDVTDGRLWYRSCTQSQRTNADLCGLNADEQGSQTWNSSHGLRWWEPCHAGRKSRLLLQQITL